MSTQLNNRFTVPVPVDQAWNVLLDVERIAPCMPGASLESVDGDSMTGKVRVKVGPITVTYRGEAHFTEIDAKEHRVEMHAGGKEARGAGTASATVSAQLFERDDRTTEVMVDTDFTVTGRVAQFGRGVMADVSAKLVAKFAENLAAELEEGGSREQQREQVPAGQAGAEGGPAVQGTDDAQATRASSGTSDAGTPANAVVPPQAGEATPEGAAETAAGASAGPDSGPPAGTPTDAGTHSPVRTDMRSDSPGMRPRDDSIDLVSTVGLPVLKRALPVIGVAALAAWIVGRLVRRRKRKA